MNEYNNEIIITQNNNEGKDFSFGPKYDKLYNMQINWTKLWNNFYDSREKATEMLIGIFSLFYVRIYLLIALSLNIVNWLFAFYFNKNVSQKNLVVLHYNINLGVDLVGNASRIYIIPLLGLLFILFNFIIAFNIYKQGKFIINLLLGSAILANILLLAGTAAVYFVNFR